MEVIIRPNGSNYGPESDLTLTSFFFLRDKLADSRFFIILCWRFIVFTLKKKEVVNSRSIYNIADDEPQHDISNNLTF